ncbi:hypothetical protein BDQ17DRAFT_1423185 [Cyathus striatus]|nr:hypothetical protein BDQ17DRAFT_1423185 [Cyathus striatus]
MFAAAVQPSIVSLFSSTGTDPLRLFSTSTDSSLPTDSLVHFLHDKLSQPSPPSPAVLVAPIVMSEDEDAKEGGGYTLDQTVLHIQSPTLPRTFIQCPPVLPTGLSGARGKDQELGIKHPWLHLQVRNLGREWSFEVGVVDLAGRMGVLRLSTFQKAPRLKLNRKRKNAPPLLHLPLSFPSKSSRPLTPWCTISLHLPTFVSYFSSSDLIDSDEEETQVVQGEHATWGLRSSTSTGVLPNGPYSHVAYVRVYANCRLRRIWFAEGGPNQKVPWEFELYSDQ